MQMRSTIKIPDFRAVALSYKNKKAEINRNYKSFLELKNGCKNNHLHIMIYTPLLSIDKINPEDLRLYLEENMSLIDDSRNGTHFRKLICLYDYLKYRLGI